tara:strand:- start:57065 stop:59002 length:1938 start_codon:yes stop_codon:yes gene_type:complete
MCGIAGLWDSTSSPGQLERIATNMTEVLRHRGPDGHGLWSEPRGGLVFGHRRLSILDLSEHGKQPMISESGRYVITYNGEIYNADELRTELGRDASSFRGHSDTEVALATIEKFGILAAAKRFNGMFAFAVWDREESSLSLVRDRVGIKPLYYGRAGKGLVFGSDSAALRQHPQFDRALNPEAVAAYLRASCIPAPLCIHRDAHKVMPGSIVRFSASDAAPVSEQFWDPLEVATLGQEQPRTSASASDLVAELDALLTDSVRRRMISDVPLGAFLSGGIDSSNVVALMAKLSSRPVQTFTIGTSEASHDESSDAKAIAKHLGTEHRELFVTPADALAVVEELPNYYDEPFADSSQIPTLLVSRMAREHVTVSLSGDGGDELFAGYNRHVWGPRVAKANAHLPAVVRRAMAKALQNVRPETLNWVYSHLVPQVGSLNMRFPADKAVKLAKAISSASTEEMYGLLANSTADPTAVLRPNFYQGSSQQKLADLGDVAHKFMFQDMTGYLPNDILTKVDRASMAVSLEARVPLLDHRVVEFAWSLPLDVKLASGQGKWILREVLAKYIPKEAMDRPKSGFGIPIGDWLRGPLKDWASELLSEQRLAEQGIFQTAPILAAWESHQSGQRDHSQHLWNVLVLQDWLERCAP